MKVAIGPRSIARHYLACIEQYSQIAGHFNTYFRALQSLYELANTHRVEANDIADNSSALLKMRGILPERLQSPAAKSDPLASNRSAPQSTLPRCSGRRT